VNETAEEMAALQELLDRSAAGGGPHLSGIIDADRRLTATQLCERLTGMRLLTVATVTAGRLEVQDMTTFETDSGTWYFSTSPGSVRMRHLRKRPAISATYLPGESLQVSVHGRAEIFPFSDQEHGAPLKQAMLDHYVPIQGPSFEEWINNNQDDGALGARIIAEKMFTFHMEDSA